MYKIPKAKFYKSDYIILPINLSVNIYKALHLQAFNNVFLLHTTQSIQHILLVCHSVETGRKSNNINPEPFPFKASPHNFCTARNCVLAESAKSLN